MMKSIRFTLALCILVCLSGCAQSAPSRFYALSAMAQPTEAKYRHAVSVGPVLIPPVVDRPQMVTRLGQNEVRIDEFNRWAVPLQKDIARVIAENLAVKLGSPHVTVFPQSPLDASAIRVTIDIRNFESGVGKNVTIDAHWTVRTPEDDRTVSGRTIRQEPCTGIDHDDRVAAYSRALERLSEDIALTLLTL